MSSKRERAFLHMVCKGNKFCAFTRKMSISQQMSAWKKSLMNVKKKESAWFKRLRDTDAKSGNGKKELALCCLLLAKMIYSGEKKDCKIGDLITEYEELVCHITPSVIKAKKNDDKVAQVCIENNIKNVKKGNSIFRNLKEFAQKDSAEKEQDMDFACKTIYQHMKAAGLLKMDDKIELQHQGVDGRKKTLVFTMNKFGAFSFEVPAPAGKRKQDSPTTVLKNALTIADAVRILVEEGVIEDASSSPEGTFNRYLQCGSRVKVKRGDNTTSMKKLKLAFLGTKAGAKIVKVLKAMSGKEEEMQKCRVELVQKLKDGKAGINPMEILQYTTEGDEDKIVEAPVKVQNVRKSSKKGKKQVQSSAKKAPKSSKKDKGKEEEDPPTPPASENSKKLRRHAKTLKKLKKAARVDDEMEALILQQELIDEEDRKKGVFSVDKENYDDVGGQSSSDEDSDDEELGSDFIAQDGEVEYATDADMPDHLESLESIIENEVQPSKNRKRKRDRGSGSSTLCTTSDDEEHVDLSVSERKKACFEMEIEKCKGGRDALEKILMMMGCNSEELYNKLSSLGLKSRLAFGFISEDDLRITGLGLTPLQEKLFISLAHRASYEPSFSQRIVQSICF